MNWSPAPTISVQTSPAMWETKQNLDGISIDLVVNGVILCTFAQGGTCVRNNVGSAFLQNLGLKEDTANPGHFLVT